MSCLYFLEHFFLLSACRLYAEYQFKLVLQMMFSRSVFFSFSSSFDYFHFSFNETMRWCWIFTVILLFDMKGQIVKSSVFCFSVQGIEVFFRWTLKMNGVYQVLIPIARFHDIHLRTLNSISTRSGA